MGAYNIQFLREKKIEMIYVIVVNCKEILSLSALVYLEFFYLHGI